MPLELTVQGFHTAHRLVLPMAIHCEGESYTQDGPVTDSVKRSVVLWYGVSSTVVWQGHEWFPGRPARVRELAETGY
jgi:hypothetical protein